MNIKIKKLHKGAVIPYYASAGAACFDLVATEDVMLNNTGIFYTGLSFEIPEGCVMLVFSRSGHGFKDDVRLSNCVGVIDSDYRGEVMVKLRADQNRKVYHKGTRIAQAMILPVAQVEFTPVDNLGATDRGSGGFGSTDT